MSANNHWSLARELGVDHGDAVSAAREFCPSGYGAGEHGSTCPCDACTTIAVKVIAAYKRKEPV